MPTAPTSKPRFVGEKVKLGSYFSYIKNGYNVKQGKDKGGIPITRIETLSDDRFNRNKVGYADIFSTKGLENRVLEDGDILMSHINSLPYLGRSVMYRARPDEVFIHGMNLLRLKADRSIVEPAYAELYFRTPHFKQQILKIAKKAVNQASISVSNLKELDFPLMSLHDQRVVIERLSLIITQMEQCERTTKRLDSLVKSRFVEMFENGSTDTVRLGDCCERITKGTTPTTAGYSFIDDGVNFIKVETLSDSGNFIPEKLAHISRECHDALKRSQLKEGDLLFSIAGAIGRIAIVTSDVIPANTNQALAIIRLNNNAPFELSFLKQALSSSAVAAVAEKLKRGAAQINLSLKDVGNFLIPCPDDELQKEYSAFVHQVDKSRFVRDHEINFR